MRALVEHVHFHGGHSDELVEGAITDALCCFDAHVEHRVIDILIILLLVFALKLKTFVSDDLLLFVIIVVVHVGEKTVCWRYSCNNNAIVALKIMLAIIK